MIRPIDSQVDNVDSLPSWRMTLNLDFSFSQDIRQLIEVLGNLVRPGAQGIEWRTGPIDPADFEAEAFSAQRIPGVRGDKKDLLFWKSRLL